MAALFRSLFERFGHVYQHPRFKKDTKTYEWNLSTILDSSFEFLLEDRVASWNWIKRDPQTILAYLAGAWDAEGSVGISKNAKCTAIMLPIFNTDINFLEFIKAVLIQIGYHPVGPYLDKEKNTITSKYKIERKKDYWKLVLANFDESQSLLRRLPILHPEKTKRKDLALSIVRGTKWAEVSDGVKSLRRAEIAGRDTFVRLAEVTYLENHPKTVASGADSSSPPAVD
jgi:hypothetical protein